MVPDGDESDAKFTSAKESGPESRPDGLAQPKQKSALKKQQSLRKEAIEKSAVHEMDDAISRAVLKSKSQVESKESSEKAKA